jgi:hypothetical protein
MNFHTYLGKLNPFLLLGFRVNKCIGFDSDFNSFGFKLINQNNTTYSYQIGIGSEIKINEYLTLLPQIRYNQDIINSLKVFSVMINDLKFTNYSWDFLLGVKF